MDKQEKNIAQEVFDKNQIADLLKKDGAYVLKFNSETKIRAKYSVVDIQLYVPIVPQAHEENAGSKS